MQTMTPRASARKGRGATSAPCPAPSIPLRALVPGAPSALSITGPGALAFALAMLSTEVP